ncbi:MAG: hypothetical protein BRC30_02165 [Nanohaloarchaea archaeon SW_7_46_7]|nr:MAG: hypothetical protein BRC30_02165 [Nanohaloarchaea archaeon SW_7_46_7]
MAKATFRHSDKAFEQVENIVEASEYLENKSEFYQTVTDYALESATDGDYRSDIDNFKAKAAELGLDQLSSNGFDHFDFASTVYLVSHDESRPADERIEYLQKLSEQEIEQHFPDSDLADSIGYL